ncbi:NACHT domain-containing protein [Myxosarcina sp. GI1(2024)]
MLRQWTSVDKCRLIGIWGLNGVGKTVLMQKLVQEIKSEFELVIWLSAIEAPTPEELVRELLPSGLAARPERGNFLTQLIELMRSHSCLILLDGIETIMQPGAFSGKYRSGYEVYGEIFRLVAESCHQSCIMLSSLENPGGIFHLKQRDSAVRSLKLSGLSESEAKLLLKTEGLIPSPTWQSLIDYYQGNPAILSIAAQIIRELFSGNVKEFLAQKSLVFGEIARLLNQSLSRLSVLETEILYWSICKPKPVSLS